MEQTQEQTTQDLEIAMPVRHAIRLLLILFVVVQVSWAAVDCGNPLTRQQRVVCATPELMDLDRQLWSVYKSVLAARSGIERSQIEHDQASWEVSSGACWDRVDCIKKRYMDRLAALEAVTAKASVPKPVQPSAAEPTTPKASSRFQDGLNGLEVRNQVPDAERLDPSAAFEEIGRAHV